MLDSGTNPSLTTESASFEQAHEKTEYLGSPVPVDKCWPEIPIRPRNRSQIICLHHQGTGGIIFGCRMCNYSQPLQPSNGSTRDVYMHMRGEDEGCMLLVQYG